jgi:hypothetical protein
MIVGKRTISGGREGLPVEQPDHEERRQQTRGEADQQFYQYGDAFILDSQEIHIGSGPLFKLKVTNYYPPFQAKFAAFLISF